jgi:hypothetical protein
MRNRGHLRLINIRKWKFMQQYLGVPEVQAYVTIPWEFGWVSLIAQFALNYTIVLCCPKACFTLSKHNIGKYSRSVT